jgi:hypothetical protein
VPNPNRPIRNFHITGHPPAVTDSSIPLLQAQLANEMLVRGAVLGGASKWVGVYLTTVQRVPEATSGALAGWLTLGLGTAFVSFRQWNIYTMPVSVKAAKVEKDKITGKLKVRPALSAAVVCCGTTATSWGAAVTLSDSSTKLHDQRQTAATPNPPPPQPGLGLGFARRRATWTRRR